MNRILKSRVIFANGRMTFPFFIGGDGILFHNLARKLYENKIDVESFGCLYPPKYALKDKNIFSILDNAKLRYEVSGEKQIFKSGHGYFLSNKVMEYNIPYKATMVELPYFFERFDRKLRERKKNIVITSTNLAPEIIDFCYEKKTPIILYVIDAEPSNFWSIERKDKIDFVLFVSEYLAKKYNGLINSSDVLHVLFNFNEFILRGKKDKKFITLVNPIEEKGGKILQGLAKIYPNKKFLAVEGWYKPDIDFSKFKNIIRLPKQRDNLKSVFAKTKILLVPSQWEEALATVSVLARINGIPVLASNKGGIPEAVGSGGYLVDDYKKINAWADALKKIDNPIILNRFTDYHLGLDKFDIDKQIDKFINILRDIS